MMGGDGLLESGICGESWNRLQDSLLELEDGEWARLSDSSSSRNFLQKQQTAIRNSEKISTVHSPSFRAQSSPHHTTKGSLMVVPSSQ